MIMLIITFIIFLIIVYLVLFKQNIKRKINNGIVSLQNLAAKYSMQYEENENILPVIYEKRLTNLELPPNPTFKEKVVFYFLSKIFEENPRRKYFYVRKILQLNENNYIIFLGISKRKRNDSKFYKVPKFTTYGVIKNLRSTNHFSIFRIKVSKKGISKESNKIKIFNLKRVATNIPEFDKNYLVYINDETKISKIITPDLINYLLNSKFYPLTIELRNGILKFYTESLFLQTEEEYLELYNFMLTLLKNIENADN